MDLAAGLRDRRALTMTALGLASGIVVSFTYSLDNIPQELSVGIVFGIVMACYLYYLKLADPAKAAIYALLTVLAWFIAERAAVHIFDALPGSGSGFLTGKGLATGILAGAIGAFLLVLAGALLFPFFRRRELGLVTVIAGAVLGALFCLIDVFDSGLALFPLWQAGVAYCLALALPKGASGP